MHITNLEEGRLVFKALASETRSAMVRLLLENREMNLNDLAAALGLTNGALTAHVRELEACGLVEIRSAPARRGSQKVCRLAVDSILVDLTASNPAMGDFYEAELPVGGYSSFSVEPNCGIATRERIIGEFDDPRCFDDPERVRAGVLWFTRGFVEYRIPNYLRPGLRPTEIRFVCELSSEAPGTCEDWPSDIHFSLNGKPLGVWTSPGDFGARRGHYNPAWWFPTLNQYGLLKSVTVKGDGTWLDGRRISDTTIDSLGIDNRSDLSLVLSVPPDAPHVGGLTIFGRGFGNYGQDIHVRVSFSSDSARPPQRR
jgi:predicted transcriptional regulator